MAIQALPPSTVRAIGASQVLTDPNSVVKELIDNSLDAKSTAIFVEISVNTVDVIQVRDNGHGIAPEDRALVCRRYCTSKIRDLSDLKVIGGTSLGFRGEALTSAAELCGTLTVTTKIEGEEVAVALKIGRDGEVVGRDRASHPFGTTVRLTDVFHALPVRKQTALKGTAKCLTKIKQMMQAYALARPTVRFSLRVLKAKNEKGDWVYAPKANSSIEDAAFKVVGKECASQCSWSVIDYEGFEVQAFIPNPTADASKISGIGSFLSIDSRPVSTVRGILRQIMVKFRDRLRGCDQRFEMVKDPFAWININCPSESYDANIEPAKDDVLFEEGNKPVTAVEALLDQFYPKPQRSVAEIGSPLSSPRRKRNQVSILEDDDDSPMERTNQPAAKRQRLLGTMDNQDQRHPSPIALEETPNVSNPWIIAKLSSKPQAQRNHLASPLHDRKISQLNETPESWTMPTFPSWNAPSPLSSPFRRRLDQIEIISENDEPEMQPRQRPLDIQPPTPTPTLKTEDDSSQQGQPKRRWTGWQPPSQFTCANLLPLGTPGYNNERRIIDESPPPEPRRLPKRQRVQIEDGVGRAELQDEYDYDEREERRVRPRRTRDIDRHAVESETISGVDRRQTALTSLLSTSKSPRLRGSSNNPTFKPFKGVRPRAARAVDEPARDELQEDDGSRITSFFAPSNRALPRARQYRGEECSEEALEPEHEEHISSESCILAPPSETHGLLSTLNLSISTLNDLSASLRALQSRSGSYAAGHAGHEVWGVRCAGLDAPHDNEDEDEDEQRNEDEYTEWTQQNEPPTSLLNPQVSEEEAQPWQAQLRDWLAQSGIHSGVMNLSDMDMKSEIDEHVNMDVSGALERHGVMCAIRGR